MDSHMETKFTLKDLEKSKIPINKTWFYRNCIPTGTRICTNGVHNLYTLPSVQKVIQRKRDELKKYYPDGNITRHKAELKLVAIEHAINKFFLLKKSRTDSSDSL